MHTPAVAVHFSPSTWIHAYHCIHVWVCVLVLVSKCHDFIFIYEHALLCVCLWSRRAELALSLLLSVTGANHGLNRASGDMFDFIYRKTHTHIYHSHTHTHKLPQPRITLWITSSRALDRVRHKENNRLTFLMCIEQISNLSSDFWELRDVIGRQWQWGDYGFTSYEMQKTCRTHTCSLMLWKVKGWKTECVRAEAG